MLSLLCAEPAAAAGAVAVNMADPFSGADILLQQTMETNIKGDLSAVKRARGRVACWSTGRRTSCLEAAQGHRGSQGEGTVVWKSRPGRGCQAERRANSGL